MQLFVNSFPQSLEFIIATIFIAVVIIAFTGAALTKSVAIITISSFPDIVAFPNYSQSLG